MRRGQQLAATSALDERRRKHDECPGAVWASLGGMLSEECRGRAGRSENDAKKLSAFRHRFMLCQRLRRPRARRLPPMRGCGRTKRSRIAQSRLLIFRDIGCRARGVEA